ncbi:MAG: hypothetical protein K0R57_2758 [Paenibacillaceae bacterium]|nr:hypothetical protein [Paenibacillaceae bacterium]
MVKRMKWEYLVSRTPDEMSQLGLEGWELVSVTAAGTDEAFYYKRPAPSVSEAITLEQRARVLKKGEQS